MMDWLQALLGEDAQKFSILFITVLVFGGIMSIFVVCRYIVCP